MNKLNLFRGDKTIWAMIFLLAIASFLPVYSASTNLVYTIGKGTTFGYLIKHFVHLIIGLGIVYVVHLFYFEKFKKIAIFGYPFVVGLVYLAALKGKTIGGANASRWLEIPVIGVSFQPSTIAFTFLIIYVARTMVKIKDTKYDFKESVFKIWLPVVIILFPILISNFSTAALIFLMICMVAFIANYPLKYLAIIFGLGASVLALFITLHLTFPKAKMFNRAATWIDRVENFSNKKPNEDLYQIEYAKIAIATGGIQGLGPGKSVQKNFLPQSSSDFIFAIIVEEYGLLGGFGLIFIYLVLFFRFLIRSNKAPNLFGQLLIIGLGFPIIFQALINMGVAVELLPVTGQPLPLISSGGTSIWMTCISLGIILSVTKKENEIAQDNLDQQKRAEALERIINREVALEVEKTNENSDEKLNENKVAEMKAAIKKSLIEENETNGDSLYNGQNPMNSVINKK